MVVYPILVWDDFKQTYDKHQHIIDKLQDRVWIATFLSVLAHALQSASHELLERNAHLSPAQLFADSLHVLDHSTIMTQTTPELVQCLLLMTAFAQTLNQPDLSVSMLGLSVFVGKAREASQTLMALESTH